MECKKCMMYGMLGGMVMFGYLKYKDGTIERMIKNMKPMAECALEELKKTDENTEVFKQAGTLLIKVEYSDALSEMEEKLETLQLRKQTMARQEERVMKKLEEMQSTIQAAMQGMGQ